MAPGLHDIHIFKRSRVPGSNCVSSCCNTCAAWCRFSPLERFLCSLSSWRRFLSLDAPRHIVNCRWCCTNRFIWHSTRAHAFSRGPTRPVQATCICCIFLLLGYISLPLSFNRKCPFSNCIGPNQIDEWPMQRHT